MGKTKTKSLLSRLTAVALTILCSVSFLFSDGITAGAFASTAVATQKKLSDWKYDFQNSGLPNGYNISTGAYDDDQFKYAWVNQVPYFTTNDGRYAYCIHFGLTHENGSTSSQETIEDYLSDHKHITTEHANLIKAANIYSYKGTTQYGYSESVELCASIAMTQAVSAKFFDSSTTSLGTNEEKLLKCYTYTGSGNATTQWNNLKACYLKMKEEILSHYDIPDGTSSEIADVEDGYSTYKLTYNISTNKWTGSIKGDSTLAQFSVPTAITGVTFSRTSDTTIAVSATTAGAKNLADLTALCLTKTKGKYVSKIDECSSLILSGNSAVQEMVTSDYGDLDPVEAYVAFELNDVTLDFTKTVTAFISRKGKSYPNKS